MQSQYQPVAATTDAAMNTVNQRPPNNVTVLKPRILIMAGGTGGHVFPGLAVAKRLQAEGFDVLWLGTKRGLEADIIPKASLPIQYLTITGIRGKGFQTRLLAPFRLMWALFQAIQLIKNYQPDVVLGMGGFVTGPGGVAAWLLRRPLVIHEQNAIAGITNRLLAPLAKRVLAGFPGSFPESSQALWTGNPVREALNQSAMAGSSHRVERSGPRLRILLLGGSQGAAFLNQLLPKAIQLIPVQHPLEIWHQAGGHHAVETQKAYQDAKDAKSTDHGQANHHSVRVDPFIADMETAYDWADLVICRSGALTVAELSAMGKASILVPYPFAVDDHQTQNGRFLEKAGAAKVISQTVLDPQKLADVIISLSNDPNALRLMAEAARQVAKPEALNEVTKQCIEVSSEFKSKSQKP